MMSDADLAYAAAERLIENGPREGVIDFYGYPEFADLNRIPPQLALDQRVTALRLMGTKITSIAQLSDMFWLNRLELSDLRFSTLRPVRRIVELTELSIEGTLVRNLDALTNLDGLRKLYMANTPVDDITPLRSLYDLHDLDLEGTLVEDLRPIRDLVFLGVPIISSTRGGLIFYNTPAARRDPVLAKLAQIKDDESRTDSTLAYLKTLPPWPEPLPWLDEGKTPVRRRQVEPVLTRDRAVKASATQIKFLLRAPQMTRITAQGIAGQLRTALIDVQPVRGNELPEPIVAILAIADSLDALGQTDLSPKAKSREPDLRMRIAHLEGVVDRLTIALKDSNAARDAALAMANKDSALKAYAKSVAVGGGVLTVVLVGAGVFAGASAILGSTNPYVTALQSGLGILTK